MEPAIALLGALASLFAVLGGLFAFYKWLTRDRHLAIRRGRRDYPTGPIDFVASLWVAARRLIPLPHRKKRPGRAAHIDVGFVIGLVQHKDGRPHEVRLKPVADGKHAWIEVVNYGPTCDCEVEVERTGVGSAKPRGPSARPYFPPWLDNGQRVQRIPYVGTGTIRFAELLATSVTDRLRRTARVRLFTSSPEEFADSRIPISRSQNFRILILHGGTFYTAGDYMLTIVSHDELQFRVAMDVLNDQKGSLAASKPATKRTQVSGPDRINAND